MKKGSKIKLIEMFTYIFIFTIILYCGISGYFGTLDISYWGTTRLSFLENLYLLLPITFISEIGSRFAIKISRIFK